MAICLFVIFVPYIENLYIQVLMKIKARTQVCSVAEMTQSGRGSLGHKILIYIIHGFP